MHHFPYTGHTLRDGDVEIICRYGHWFMALENGWIKPETEAQRRFVRCCSAGEIPVSHFEVAWVNYRNAVENERLEREGRECVDRHFSQFENDLYDALATTADPLEQDRIARFIAQNDEERADIAKIRNSQGR
jgi:uncharacterized protein YifE (UPF0438 family)